MKKEARLAKRRHMGSAAVLTQTGTDSLFEGAWHEDHMPQPAPEEGIDLIEDGSFGSLVFEESEDEKELQTTQETSPGNTEASHETSEEACAEHGPAEPGKNNEPILFIAEVVGSHEQKDRE